MRYRKINQKLFIENREKLLNELKPNSVVIVHANDIMPTNSDGTMKYRQNSDLFWLTGVDQEETILLLFPDAKDSNNKEVLFVRETNDTIMTWEGKKLNKEEATEVTGIKTVHWLSEFERIFRTVMCECENVYLATNEHKRAVIEVETRNARFVKRCLNEYPLHNYERLAPIMHKLRAIKSPYEVELLQEACNLVEYGFRRVLKFLKPGVMEYEVEAEFAHEFIKRGASMADYTPIIASGGSACVLHYIENDKVCKDGDLLLIDVGAGYANYNSDLTRTIPVNGKYSKRQKDVYNAVLRVMKKHQAGMKPGVQILDLQKMSEQNIEKELVDLGLLTMDDIKNQNPSWPAFKKYFMHGVSHFLGLDVHDVGDPYRKLEPGMVFTCEPGIYIREEGIGIRIENDILITEDGNFDLMKNIPREVEEIEEIMNSK